MQEKNTKKVLAVVASRSGDKSVKVGIDYMIKHPRYGKYIKRRKYFGVHDAHNEASVGDVVEVTPCRPHSKMKTWRLVRIVEKSPQSE